jgi:hypothetical protein
LTTSSQTSTQINDRAELVAFLAPLKAPNDPPDSERARLTRAVVRAPSRCWKGRGFRWIQGKARKFFCSEILCVGCLEKRLGRQLTPADFPPGRDIPNNYMSKRLRNRAYGT